MSPGCWANGRFLPMLQMRAVAATRVVAGTQSPGSIDSRLSGKPVGNARLPQCPGSC
jgi:hypothetical protein